MLHPRRDRERLLRIRGFRRKGLYWYYSNDGYEPSACDNFIHVIDLLKSEGYEPDESEAAMYAEAQESIAAYVEEEAEEAEEEQAE